MSTSAPRLEASGAGPSRRLADLVLGYDVFVSYAWLDGRAFAAELASRLRERGWRVFLDDAEIAAGAELAAMLGASLRKSSALVVVASHGAMSSPHVASEVEAFGRTGRPVVPIFPGQSRDAGDGPLAETLRRRVFLERRGEPPDDALVRQLESSLRFVRRSRIRVLVATGLAAALALLALIALLQARAADHRAFEVELQLAARRTEDVLSTSRQAEALPAAISSARDALSRLGAVPPETRRALWLAYEGAREVEAYVVPAGTYPAAIAPDGRILAMMPDAQVATLYGGQGRVVWRIPEGEGELLPSGRGILVTKQGLANQVRAPDGRSAARFTFSQPAAGLLDVSADLSVLARSPDRRHVLVGARGADERAMVVPFASRLMALRLAPGGGLLVVVGEDGAAAWLDVATGRVRRTLLSLGHPDAVALSDNARIAAMLVDREVRLLSINPGEDARFHPRTPATQLQTDTPPTGIAVSDGRRTAVSYDNSGAVLVFGPDGVAPVPPLLGAETPTLYLSRDGLRLATADKTGRAVRVYDLGPRTVRAVGGAGRRGEMATAIAVCGDRLVWGGIEGALSVTEVASERRPESWALRSPHGRVAAIACSGPGAVTGDQDGRVFHWEGLARGARPDLLDGDARLLAAQGDLVAGIGADEVSLWRPARSPHRLATLPLRRLGLSMGQGTAIQFLAGGDLLIAGDHPSSGAPVTVERWTLSADGGTAIRRWRRQLPNLLLVRASTPADGGRSVYVSGILDSLYRVDGSGSLAWVAGGILRPAPDSLAGLPDGSLAASSLWGAINILDRRGRRLLGPMSSSRGNLRVASGPRGRVFASGEGGEVEEVVLDTDRLLALACSARRGVEACVRSR